MFILAVLNLKGGATKSTTAVNLARAFQKKGYSVALGETDSQKSLDAWYVHGSEEPLPLPLPLVFDMQAKDRILSARNNESLSGLDMLIIDGKANGYSELLSTVKVADFVLVPSQPSPADTTPISEVVEVADLSNTPLAFVMTRTKKGDNMTEYVGEMLGEHGKPVLKNTIRDLKGFRLSYAAGHSVFEYTDYAEAQKDVMSVAEELLTHFSEE